MPTLNYWDGTNWVPIVGGIGTPETGTVVGTGYINVSDTTPVTLLTFTLPSAGTWDVTYTARCQTGTNLSAYGVASLHDAAGTVVPNSELLVHQTAAITTTGNNGATATSRVFITTTGPATFTLRGRSGGAYVTAWNSDAAGWASVSWVRLARGPKGDKGDPGPAGGSIDLGYTYSDAATFADLVPDTRSYLGGDRPDGPPVTASFANQYLVEYAKRDNGPEYQTCYVIQFAGNLVSVWTRSRTVNGSWFPWTRLDQPPSAITYASVHTLSFPNNVVSTSLTLTAPPAEYPQTRPDIVICEVLGGTAIIAHTTGYDAVNDALPVISGRRVDGAAYNGTRELRVLRVWNQ